MIASFYENDHFRETIETRSFHGLQWMSFEELYDLRELRDSSGAKLFSITMIRGDLSVPEKFLQPLQNRYILLMLHHSKLWKDLPTDLHGRLPIDANEETTFSIDKPDNPFGTQSFLLIICTHHIVTPWFKASSVGFSDLPAYSQILLRLACVNLRTVHAVTVHLLVDGGALISVALYMSPCSSDFIIALLRHRKASGVKSLRISQLTAMRSFLLIARTSWIFTAAKFTAST
jgi:hypothetical protein